MKNMEQLQDYPSNGSIFTTTTSSNQSLGLLNTACQHHLERHLGENSCHQQQLLKGKNNSNVYEEDDVIVQTSDERQVPHLNHNISSSRKVVFSSANEELRRQSNCDKVVVDSDHYLKLRRHAATLWKENIMTDITVYIGTKTYPAHKVVLTSYSPFFKGHIMAKGLENINKIKMIGIKPAAFDVLLQFMYTGVFKPGIYFIGDVYRASLKLKIWEVSQKCMKLLKREEGGPSSILYVYATSKMLGLTQAAACARETILKEFEDVIVTPEFLDLEASHLCEILSADAIATRSEIVIYLTALKWLDHDFLNREEYMLEVMKCVRFPTMTLEEVLACFHPPILPRITQMPALRDLLLKATCYLAAKSTKQNRHFEEYSSKPRLFLAKRKHGLKLFSFEWGILRAHNRAATRIQSFYRGYVLRKEFLRKKKAAIIIEAHVRGYHARTSYSLIKSKPQLSYNIKGNTICLDDPSLQTLIHSSDSTHISCQSEVRFALLPKCEGSLQETNTAILLILGGINPNNLSGTNTGDSMLRYLPIEDKWEHCGYLPEPRYYHMAVLLNRCVYVIVLGVQLLSGVHNNELTHRLMSEVTSNH
ncbi:uncharacterized protein LOC143249999 [Tachypleus tridentatus]|uniref:uncharacterized protein LOC143249999 n=1 Tax=Tachypleus tridentatus TaxID=6853 RepID=UPI003FD56F6A